jgi:molecular chaperone GrpE
MDSDVKHLDENGEQSATEATDALSESDEQAAEAEQPDESSAAEPSELDATRDRLLRVTAEFDNYRKRTDRERREMSQRAAEELLTELLPIVDDLERALEADSGADGATAYRTGVELIHRQLLDLLGRRGVTPIDALGAEFDPHLHQAVASEPADGRADGEVIEEFRRGYRLGERLLRPAMVKVAKA